MERYRTVDAYLEGHSEWREVLVQLREIMNGADMDETVKWGAPCYTVNGKNVVGLGAFQDFVSVWFHQGALLKDPHKILVNAQEGKTKALRQWRISRVDQIDTALLRSYVDEAIENQKQGREIKADRGKPVVVPDDMAEALANREGASGAFDALSPGKRREYAEYIASAKREETRQKRLDKIIPMILDGRGLNDKYRN